MQSQTLRVLLAEDGITETGITLRALCADQGRGLELVFVSNASRLPHALLHSQPHIAFLALSLLQPDPPSVITSLHQSAPHIPLILFVPPADKASAIICLHAGAENYMLKGFLDVPTLDHVLHTALRRDAQGVPAAPLKPRLHFITNLPTRSGLLQLLHRSRPDSVLSGSKVLLSVHLTNLKYLQATAGPAAVSHALRETAKQLRSTVRRSDLIAYIAPGVFALVVFDVSDSCLAAVRRRINSRLLHLFQGGLVHLPLNFSVKTSSCANASSFSFQEILADHLSCKNLSALPPLAPARNTSFRSNRGGTP